MTLQHYSKTLTTKFSLHTFTLTHRHLYKWVMLMLLLLLLGTTTTITVATNNYINNLCKCESKMKKVKKYFTFDIEQKIK